MTRSALTRHERRTMTRSAPDTRKASVTVPGNRPAAMSSWRSTRMSSSVPRIAASTGVVKPTLPSNILVTGWPNRSIPSG
ncbi:hypothetical protein [Nocardia abscessus]|uniref:hypothetical protein n=1 Tax=Nocardia abscessus TaxID=120957 RepID=UPI0024539AE3|nr:hypothetical protein [Nocardia abscessus]